MMPFNTFKLSSLTLMIFISACQSISHQTAEHKTQSTQQHLDILSAHLNRYVGQPIDQVQDNIELASIGLKFSQKPVRNQHTLSFSFIRQMSISVPLAAPIRYMDANGVFVPSQTASIDHTVTTPLQCTVIFPIKEELTQSYILQGRGC